MHSSIAHVTILKPVPYRWRDTTAHVLDYRKVCSVPRLASLSVGQVYIGRAHVEQGHHVHRSSLLAAASGALAVCAASMAGGIVRWERESKTHASCDS